MIGRFLSMPGFPASSRGMVAMKPDTPNGRRLSAVEQVVNALFHGLMNNRFAPGQRLIEADLTAEFGVSRGTLRDAFRRLAADGLVEIVPNRGAIVRRLSARDMTELFQIRTELEGLAARLAASRMGDAAVRERFEAAIAPIWGDAPRLHITRYIDENARFHEAILEASGNRHLATVSRQFQLPVIMGQVGGLLTPETIGQSVAEHRDLARAILEGNAELAERGMKDHLARARNLTEAYAAPGKPL